VTVDAGEDTITCSNMPVTILGASSGGAAEIHWTHNGTGTLTGDNTISPTYIPGENESGTVTLEVLATGIAPCVQSPTSFCSILSRPRSLTQAALSACDQFRNHFDGKASNIHLNMAKWLRHFHGSYNVNTSLPEEA
jgi:hypothetical protein